MKKVFVEFEFDTEGKMHVHVRGTEGTECIDLTRCVEILQGVKVTHDCRNADYHKRPQGTMTTAQNVIAVRQ